MPKGGWPYADCRSPHGERGLKFCRHRIFAFKLRRSPHGERGLKYHYPNLALMKLSSLPSRGAWIEIVQPASTSGLFFGRSPHGERGLK